MRTMHETMRDSIRRGILNHFECGYCGLVTPDVTLDNLDEKIEKHMQHDCKKVLAKLGADES